MRKLGENTRTCCDLFKGIAILMVVLTHSHQPFAMPGWASFIQRFGQLGCQIFFVLSAYGLCLSYEKNPMPYGAFMKKRVGKLAIGYWTMLLFWAVYRLISALIKGGNVISALNLPGIAINALFLHGLVPSGTINNNVVEGGWYVGTTVILYALFPLLYKIYTAGGKRWAKRRAVLFPAAIAAASACVMIAASLVHPFFVCANNSIMYRLFLNQLPCFALGFSLYDLLGSGEASKIKAPGLLALGFGILTGVLFYLEPPHAFVFVPTLFGVAFVYVFVMIVRKPILADTLTGKGKWLQTCGKMSYSIYLTHLIVVFNGMKAVYWLCSGWATNQVLWYYLTLPVSLVAVFALGWCYHRYLGWMQSKCKI